MKEEISNEFYRVLTAKELDGTWKPPLKNHGGEDIPRLFVIQLLDFSSCQLLLPFYRKGNLDYSNYPITQGLKILVDEAKEVSKRLREKGLFFYDEGSIYYDFKIMWEPGVRELREQGKWTYADLFNINMTTEEAFELAQEIVDGWAWEE